MYNHLSKMGNERGLRQLRDTIGPNDISDILSFMSTGREVWEKCCDANLDVDETDSHVKS